MMYKKYLNMILFYTIIFFLIYLEPINIGPIKFSILWKMLLLLLLVFYSLVYISRSFSIQNYSLFGLLFSLKKLFTISSFFYLGSAFIEFSRFFIFPIILYVFPKIFKIEQLEFIVKNLSILVVLSFVPFMLGLLEPLGEETSLTAYGYSEASSLIGFFQNPHSASITLAFSIIILFYFFQNSIRKKDKLFFSLLILLGILEIYLVLVRTGWTMLLFAVIYALYKKRKASVYMKYIPLLFIGALVFYFQYQTNDILQMRLQDTNKYQQEAILGSGRFLFAYYAFQHWLNNGIEPIAIGLGTEYAKNLMEIDTGLRVFAHNGFLEILQSDGLIGMMFYLLMIFYLYSYIRKNRQSKYYLITSTLFFVYLVEMLFQGGDYFLLYILFASYVSLIKLESMQLPISDNSYDFKNKKEKHINENLS